MPFLRQSTSQTIRFGPCLDMTDGVTEETALTLAQADMRLSKDGGAFAQKNAVGNATHDSDGWYSTTLNATDTNTVGELILNVHQPANMLPVWMRWWVLEEAIYDDVFGAAAAGYNKTTPLTAAQVNAECDTALTDYGALKPTVAGRTLDIALTGESGIDFNNVLGTLDAANIGADAITAAKVAPGAIAKGDQLTGLNDLSAAQVNTEVDTALSDVNLDHLVGTAAGIPAIVAGTYLDQIMDDGTAVFDRTTDSLQAIRDTAPLGTAMRGTDSAALASVCTEARLAELDAANLPTDVSNVQADTDDIQTRLPAALVGGRMDSDIGAMQSNVIPNSVSGTADSGTTTTMVDAARTEADTDYWKGSIIAFTSGTLLGQARLITGFTPATDTITFSPATTVAVGMHTYVIIPAGRADVALWLGTAVNALIAGRMDSNAQAGIAPLGTAMRGTDNAALASVATEARLSELDAANLPLTTDSIKTETDKIALVDAGAGAVGSVIEEVENRATPAQVNAEVDSALDTAVPVTPTANSINERLKTLDDADIPGRLPAALVAGRMDASVGAMAANVLNAAAIAANALTATKFAADSIDAAALATTAVDEIAAAILATPANLLSTDASGRVDVGAVGGDTDASTNLRRALIGDVRGTASGIPTPTSIPTSSLVPAASVADQFKGRILTFDKNTTTAALRGQATDITANTAAGVLTVTALTTAPVSGDTFVVT